MKRTRRFALVLAAAAVAGCSSASGQAPSAPMASITSLAATARSTATTAASPSSPAPHETLTGQGFGGVAVGSTLAEFSQVMSRPPKPMTSAEQSVFADHGCAIRQLTRLPGVGLMVTGDDPEGAVRRIAIEEGSDIRTDKGIRVGSRLTEVRAVYGPGLNEPFDHYPVGGDALLVRSEAGSDLFVAFIGDDRDRVVEFRVGYKPEILYPEGCV